MIIYEITAIVREDLVGEYENYMRERHIPDLLETGFFGAAFFTRSIGNRYRIQYHAHDQKALDEYLKTKAEFLRNDFFAHFPKAWKFRVRIGKFCNRGEKYFPVETRCIASLLLIIDFRRERL